MRRGEAIPSATEQSVASPAIPSSAEPHHKERSESPLANVARVALWIALPPTVWILFVSRMSTFGMDSAHAYWNVWRVGPYTLPPGSQDAFNYTPAFAQMIYPLTLLPWPVFLAVWTTLLLAALVWLLWPLTPRWRWLLLAYVAPPALLVGNIEAFLALASVVGLRHPAAWAFPLLTKVTPGLGPVWFAVRREWRQCVLTAATTAALVAVSGILAPSLWGKWWHFVVHAPTPPTQDGYPALWLRCLVAVSVAAWGATKGRRGAIAVAMAVAMPLWSSGVLIVLAALPRLTQRGSATAAEFAGVDS